MDDILQLDPATKEDLMLYAVDTEATDETNNLFSFCNHCRTEGGEAVLRRRMDHPSSNAQSIRQTQIALQYLSLIHI